VEYLRKGLTYLRRQGTESGSDQRTVRHYSVAWKSACSSLSIDLY